ncbi:GreA/GreB family elongation factor [Pararhizobium sp. LjRoot255]|uniref:GreA/GreB family elongation factor n=1 Tax=Pararhizobium sp. LjRoot255 TaxID=3342298 RepID=UPI003F50BB7D
MEIVEPIATPSTVAFGNHVTIKRGGKAKQLHTVGEDEADPAAGAIAWTSPLARALEGQAPATSSSSKPRETKRKSSSCPLPELRGVARTPVVLRLCPGHARPVSSRERAFAARAKKGVFRRFRARRAGPCSTRRLLQTEPGSSRGRRLG